jgi:hypothetical protein
MVMASMILTDTSDNNTAAPRIHDLPALMLVTTQDRARLDEQPHGELLLEERCFFGREVLFGHSYLNRRAAAANRVRTKRLPRQLVERWADFDEQGRPY